MLVKNNSKNKNLGLKVKIADSFLTRLTGLMGRPGLEPGNGLALQPCRSVHTFFMRFPIDVIFINKEGEIVFLAENLRPFRITPLVKNACLALELPAGTISRTDTAKGDKISFRSE